MILFMTMGAIAFFVIASLATAAWQAPKTEREIRDALMQPASTTTQGIGIFRRSGRLFRISDPVYLEVMTGAITLLFGMLFFSSAVYDPMAVGRPTDTSVLLAIAPRFVWGFVLFLFGLMQIASTIYEIRIMSSQAATWLFAIWFVVTISLVNDGGLSVRPLASIVSPIMTLSELVVFIWQARLRHEE
jgi:hypothetical protein